MSPKKYRVQIDLLNLPAKPDFDEIVLKVHGKRLFPLKDKYYKIKAETTILINVEFEIEHHHRPLLVELWEYRYFLPDDYIGLFKLEPINNDNGKIETEMTNNVFSVKISLVWSASPVITNVYREAAEQFS